MDLGSQIQSGSSRPLSNLLFISYSPWYLSQTDSPAFQLPTPVPAPVSHPSLQKATQRNLFGLSFVHNKLTVVIVGILCVSQGDVVLPFCHPFLVSLSALDPDPRRLLQCPATSITPSLSLCQSLALCFLLLLLVPTTPTYHLSSTSLSNFLKYISLQTPQDYGPYHLGWPLPLYSSAFLKAIDQLSSDLVFLYLS